MHIYTHLRPGREALAAPHSSEMDIYGSGMIEHDQQVGELLRSLDDRGLSQNTIVVFNLRMDPFERHDGQVNNDIAMKLGVAWGGQVQDALAAHLKSLQDFPPRQAGGTLRPGGD